METAEPQGSGAPQDIPHLSPRTSVRQSCTRVEFKLADTGAVVSTAAEQVDGEARHSWDPTCVPTTSSLLVRTSLTPEMAVSSRPNSGDGSSRNVSRQPAGTPNVLPSSGVDSTPCAGEGSGGGVGLPPLATTGSTARGLLRLEAPRRWDGIDAVATATPLADLAVCMATGQQPSFVEGRAGMQDSPSLLGAEREPVFTDAPAVSAAHTLSRGTPVDTAAPTTGSGSPNSATRKAGKEKEAKAAASGTAPRTRGDSTAFATTPPHSTDASPGQASTSPPLPVARGSVAADPQGPRARQRSMSPGTAPRRSVVRSPAGATASSTTAAPAKPSRPNSGKPRPSVGDGGGPSAPGSRGTSSGSRKRSGTPAARLSSTAGMTITEKALKSINYAAFTAGNLKPQARRAKMTAELYAAHHRGAQMLEEEWAVESAQLSDDFVRESFEPHRRELLRLGAYIDFLRSSCHEKLEFAATTCNATLDGVEDLIHRMHDDGYVLAEETGALTFVDRHRTEATGGPEMIRAGLAALTSARATPADTPAPVTDAARPLSTLAQQRDSHGDLLTEGAPAAEVRDAATAWTSANAHPAAQRVPAAEVASAAAVHAFFTEEVGKLRAAAVALSMPPPIADVMTSDHAESADRLRAEALAHKAARAAEAVALKGKLGELAHATTVLLRRVREEDARQQSLIRGLQRALDESLTRRKLADDVLSGCLTQKSQEAAYAYMRVQELESELRARIDAVNAEVYTALEELVNGSTTVCMDNNMYGDSAALLSYQKMSCLRLFASRMERNAMEQADTLRQAQEVMGELWQTAGAYLPGREEKRTILHRSLSDVHEAALQRCDRDTLLRLVHHLALQSDASTRCLVSALQEREQYLQMNEAEARAVAEREATREAVTKLLEKLHAEHCLHEPATRGGAAAPTLEAAKGKPSPPAASASATTGSASRTLERTPLSTIVRDMVSRYNTFMTFDEAHARALARQREDLALSRNPAWRPAFFDEGVPVPALETGPVVAPPPLEKSSTPATVHDTLAYLQKAHPSLAARRGTGAAVAATVSVVGEGRWGGIAPVSIGSAAATAITTTTSTSTHSGGRRAENLAWLTDTGRPSPQGIAGASAPAPGVPLRRRLLSHVQRAYRHDREELVPGTVGPPSGPEAAGSTDLVAADGTFAKAPPPPPARAKRDFDNSDLPFLQKQRRVLQPLLGGMSSDGAEEGAVTSTSALVGRTAAGGSVDAGPMRGPFATV